MLNRKKCLERISLLKKTRGLLFGGPIVVFRSWYVYLVELKLCFSILEGHVLSILKNEGDVLVFIPNLY